MADLATKECKPCKGDVPPLKGEELQKLYKDLGDGWDLVDEHHLEKDYSFPDFARALTFTNKVGNIAEQEDHHPEITVGYGHVKVQVWTHKIDGLTESDFIFAAKTEKAYGG
jgi:4a-hydroxytetrahydrobiopterin dehydratase